MYIFLNQLVHCTQHSIFVASLIIPTILLKRVSKVRTEKEEKEEKRGKRGKEEKKGEKEEIKE